MKPYAILCMMLLLALPLSAHETQVEVPREWGTLHGTLMTPDSEADSDIVALLIAGSGPTDRNCNSTMGLRTNAFAYISEVLVTEGIASYRYDKRGIGASAANSISESSLRFDDYVDDAAACVEHLVKMGYRRVLLIGHSEGSQIALAVAAHYESLPIAGIVSVSGTAHTMDHTLKIQLAHQLMAYDAGMMMVAMRIIDKIKAGERVPDDDIPQPLLSIFRESVQGYLCSSMKEKFDPQKMISGIDCPVMIVGGGMDLQVPLSEAEALHAVNRASRLVVLPQMSHTMKDTSSRDMMTQRQTVYADSSLPLSEGFVAVLREFVGGLK